MWTPRRGHTSFFAIPTQASEERVGAHGTPTLGRACDCVSRCRESRVPATTPRADTPDSGSQFFHGTRRSYCNIHPTQKSPITVPSAQKAPGRSGACASSRRHVQSPPSRTLSAVIPPERPPPHQRFVSHDSPVPPTTAQLAPTHHASHHTKDRQRPSHSSDKLTSHRLGPTALTMNLGADGRRHTARSTEA
jgi:hypothetical protein